jgi:hypothetical protein
MSGITLDCVKCGKTWTVQCGSPMPPWCTECLAVMTKQVGTCASCQHWTRPGEANQSRENEQCLGLPHTFLGGYEVDGFYPDADFGCRDWKSNA